MIHTDDWRGEHLIRTPLPTGATAEERKLARQIRELARQGKRRDRIMKAVGVTHHELVRIARLFSISIKEPTR